jgi:hypothetical protein
MKRGLILLLCFAWFSWLVKHFWILPVVDWEEHEVTGFEFRIRF